MTRSDYIAKRGKKGVNGYLYTHLSIMQLFFLLLLAFQQK